MKIFFTNYLIEALEKYLGAAVGEKTLAQAVMVIYHISATDDFHSLYLHPVVP
jgi:hypothetical protein